MVLISEAAIRQLIPHAGAMCLLQTVVEWSATHIICHTRTHRDAGHPLAIAGCLSALHLVEYGAQAMAIHGGLLSAPGRAQPGVLVAVREVRLGIDNLAAITAPLIITATRLVVSAAGSNYQFTAHADGQLLGQGRVLVMTAA